MMFTTANYQRNANQNYNEISPHTSQNDYHKTKNTQIKNTGEGVEKREPFYTGAVGEQSRALGRGVREQGCFRKRKWRVQRHQGIESHLGF